MPTLATIPRSAAAPPRALASLGVARISYGPIPYISAMEAIKSEAIVIRTSIPRMPNRRGRR